MLKCHKLAGNNEVIKDRSVFVRPARIIFSALK